jgi:hypothetical protein
MGQCQPKARAVHWSQTVSTSRLVGFGFNVSGAPLSRREIRLAGTFALVWFAMDGFWFISTLNHWFGLCKREARKRDRSFTKVAILTVANEI